MKDADTKSKKSSKGHEEIEQGSSFTESERRKPLQEGRLLDEMLEPV